MSRYEIYAKRNKDYQFDVLTYNSLPKELRVQIHYIWRDALKVGYHSAFDNFAYIRDYICRELGLEYLYEDVYANLNPVDECELYLKNGNDMQILLSLIEMSILSIPGFRSQLNPYDRMELSMDQQEAIDELNLRFRENGLGYEFSNGILIRKDSAYIHEEVTKPALHLLQEEGFEGALAEFLEAHEHFRKKENKACINSASNAFESVMKTICINRVWEVKGSGTSSQLIQTLVENKLVPSYLESYMASLRSLSTVRNKNTGHGQGDVPRPPVPDYFVNYALHLCATNIVFLIEAYRELPNIEEMNME